MTYEPLLFELSCQGEQDCVFNGDDITIVATIKNIQPEPVGFPLAYLQRRGPTVTIVDNKTGKELPLRINLAPNALLRQFTTINQGESISIETTVRRYEIITFGDRFVDVSVKVAPAVDIQIGDNPALVRFSPAVKLRILGQDKIERDHEFSRRKTPF